MTDRPRSLQSARLKRVSKKSENPWLGVADDDYDPDAFYVRSCDNKVRGDSAFAKIRMPAEVYGAIRTLIASGALGNTPINTFEAFARDALVHQMRRISLMVDDETFAEQAKLQRYLAMADSHRAESDTWTATIQGADEGFASAKKTGDRELARRLLATYEVVVEGARDPYKKQLIALMKVARQWVESGE